SADVTDLVAVARAVVDAGADGLTLINTLLGMAVDVKRRRPRLAAVTGGLSGPAIRPVAVRCVWQVASALPGVPIVGTGGVVDAGADGLTLINTLLGMAVDVKRRRPRLAAVTGGLSGPAIRPVAVRCVWQVASALPGVPIVGTGGVVDAEDAAEFLLVGATA